MTPPRLIIADDHRMIVDSLSAILSRDYEIAGVAFDGPSLVELVSHRPVDCLLLDLILPGHHGVELIPRVLALQPCLKVLVVTMLKDRWAAVLSLAAGAHGFVPKDAGIEELKQAIEAVLAGCNYVSRKVPKASHRVSMHAKHPALQCLTPRQEEILLLLGEGRSETSTADILGLSLSTIAFHKHNLMHVLGLHSDASLRQFSVLVRQSVRDSEPLAAT